jgi:hypothetical protein
MSKSARKHPFIKIGGRSDKEYKVIAHRKFRSRERRCLHRLEAEKPSDEMFPLFMREVSDTWSFPSDGLAYYMSCPWEEIMRK